MSSIPGYTLEKYVMWEHDLIVDGDTSANWSLQTAEQLGVATKRQNRHLVEAQFKQIVAIYEPHREDIERKLRDFDEQDCGWRQYYSSVFYSFDDAIVSAADAAITAFLTKPSN